MLTSVVADLGKNLAGRALAERWLTGLVYAAVVAVGCLLGQSQWSDFAELATKTNAALSPTRTAGQTLLIGAAVVAAVWASAKAAEIMQAGYGWLTTRPLPAATAIVLPRLKEVLEGPEKRVREFYKLSLVDLWPRLWIVLPDAPKTALWESRQRLDGSLRIGGWSLLYLTAGILWWPALAIGVVLCVYANALCRIRAAEYAAMVESVVDVHLNDLSTVLLDPEAQPRPSGAQTMTAIFHKDLGA